MKNSEIIIWAFLVIASFCIGFIMNTNSSPDLENTPTNNIINIETSSINEEQNLMMKYELDDDVILLEIDSLISDSIPQDSIILLTE